MTTIKEWVLENVSASFCSIRIGDAVHGIAPGSVRPVSRYFKLPGGGPDVDAARANESIKAHCEAGALRLFEREYAPKAASGAQRLWNESDPEEIRVEKVLAHRRKVKAAIAAGQPVPVPEAPAEPQAQVGRRSRGKE